MIEVEATWRGAFEEKVQEKRNFWINISIPEIERVFYCVAVVNNNQEITFTDQTRSELESHGVSVCCKVQGEGEGKTIAVSVSRNGQHKMHIKCVTPLAKINIQKGQTNCMSITPSTQLLATGHPEGGFFVHDLSDRSSPKLIRTLKGHIMDIHTVQFFPSGTVLLSGGTDMILKIWTLLQDGQCVAQLKGHQRGILCTDMIERGRNVVSSSLDGSAKLWDVSSQTVLHTWDIQESSKGRGPINQVKVLPHSTSTPTIDSKEVGTDGKIIILAGENGVLQVCDARQRNSIFATHLSSPVNTASGGPSPYLVLAGCGDGRASCWDLRQPHQVYAEYHFPHTSISKIGVSAEKCWVSTGNGGTYCWEIGKEVKESLLGDTEPINGLECIGQQVLTISRRGILRFFPITKDQ